MVLCIVALVGCQCLEEHFVLCMQNDFVMLKHSDTTTVTMTSHSMPNTGVAACVFKAECTLQLAVVAMG